jgi:NAD(P)-dependent dehydrogenase (short-subunit alcohol dehydrogenase family)
MFTLELARRQQADCGGVTANVIDPFLVRTALTSAKDVPVLFKLARPMMIRPQTAARWVARAATDERLASTTGHHFMLGHQAPTPPGSRNRNRAARLWEASTQLTTRSVEIKTRQD